MGFGLVGGVTYQWREVFCVEYVDDGKKDGYYARQNRTIVSLYMSSRSYTMIDLAFVYRTALGEKDGEIEREGEK